MVLSWKSIGLSKESIENITTSDSNFASTIINYYPTPYIKFNGNCLKNNNDSSLDAVNLYVCYELDQWSRDLDTDFTLDSSLFGSIKLTKNANPDKYKYSGYGIGFDFRSEFLLPDRSYRKNVIFGADMSSSIHIDNKEKDFLILGEGPTQILYDTTLTAEAKYTKLKSTL